MKRILPFTPLVWFSLEKERLVLVFQTGQYHNKRSPALSLQYPNRYLSSEILQLHQWTSAQLLHQSCCDFHQLRSWPLVSSTGNYNSSAFYGAHYCDIWVPIFTGLSSSLHTISSRCRQASNLSDFLWKRALLILCPVFSHHGIHSPCLLLLFLNNTKSMQCKWRQQSKQQPFAGLHEILTALMTLSNCTLEEQTWEESKTKNVAIWN